jgi:hypothetical protein
MQRYRQSSPNLKNRLPFEARLSPEMKLLLLAARPFMTEAEGQELRAGCASGLDWKEFTALIQRHRLLGLVFANLKNFNGEGLPPRLYQYLRAQAKSNQRREMSISAEIISLNQALCAKDIRAIFLKGPILSLQLWLVGHPPIA